MIILEEMIIKLILILKYIIFLKALLGVFQAVIS